MNSMSSRINFLYCFDENYNKQAFTSMISLLENVSERININIIHKSKPSDVEVPIKITQHISLEKLNLYQFKNLNYDFPKIQNTHVSEATYYRLFLDYYFDNSIDFLVYLDADTIILSDPIKKIKYHKNKLINSKKIFGARTEIYKSTIKNYESYYFNDPALPFMRLGIDEKYFNAGVLLINYQLWRDCTVGKKLINKMLELSDKIVAWDQDILNSFTNGEYIEIENNLNLFDSELLTKNINSETIIIHYLGSKKPWKTSGAFKFASKYYHRNYRTIYKANFHILHTWKLKSITDLVINIFNLKIFRLDKPFIYIVEFIKSIK